MERKMGTRYHYDRHGRYKGKTSDQPPGDGCAEIIVVIVGIFFFCSLFSGC